jgi:DNA-binding response OmpR family regulator
VLVLTELNYEVVTASSVADALAAAATAKFDLFVVDNLLTDGNGIELCKALRRTEKTTPILFYSAQAYEKDKQEAFNSGAQSYLVKPVSLPLFCETIDRLINAPAEVAQLAQQ